VKSLLVQSKTTTSSAGAVLKIDLNVILAAERYKVSDKDFISDMTSLLIRM
jgi:hypothetical protein